MAEEEEATIWRCLGHHGESATRKVSFSHFEVQLICVPLYLWLNQDPIPNLNPTGNNFKNIIFEIPDSNKVTINTGLGIEAYLAKDIKFEIKY